MKPLAVLATTGLALCLALAGCGKKEEAGNNATATALPAISAPAGRKWTEVVSATPEGGFRMGNPDAAVKVIEFGSFSCPHCRDFTLESAREREAMVDTGKLSFEYRMFVRDPVDIAVALIARCNGPDPFFALSEQIFANQSEMMTKAQAMGEQVYGQTLNKPMNERFVTLAQAVGLIDFAKQRGIAEARAKQCLTDTGAIDALVKGVQTDTKKFHIEGTPTLVMNGSVVENAASWPVMRAKLREAGI